MFSRAICSSFYSEKSNEVSATYITADDAMAPAENDPASTVGAETNEHAPTDGNGAQTKKPRKK